MADHREQLARNLHIYSPISTAHTRHESEGNIEFSFWGSSSNITSSENDCAQLGDNEAISLIKEAEFRENYKTTNLEFEHAPLFLSHTHHCCSVSDPSRSKVIEEGRSELMEMIQDMPESSYELSFQDMVVDEKHVQVQQPDPNETSLDKTLHMHSSSSNSNKAQSKKINNKKKKSKSSNRPGKISRVESMDSETFLLKMFFPSSLKKVKVDNGSSKGSSRSSSLQESIKQVGKEWRSIKRFFQARDKRGDMEDGMCQNTSSITSSIKSRNFDRNFSFSSLSCWPFFHHSKNKAKELAE